MANPHIPHIAECSPPPEVATHPTSDDPTCRCCRQDVNFTKHEPVSAFLAPPWLWEHLAPATHILLFQADSMLCANSPRKVDDFLYYDFIGAPFKTEKGFNYNGGLSIRTREKMLDIARRYTREPLSRYEDTWFWERLRELPLKPNGKPGANLPTLETASQFSVETI